MSLDDITDPRTFRWVESGVSGLARTREWDVLVPVRLPDLGDRHRTEIDFTCLGEGIVRCDEPVARALLERLIAEIADAISPPFAARAVRRSAEEWIVAARALDAELLSLSDTVPGKSLEVAVSPEGERVALVDGEAPVGFVDPATAAALEELSRRGRARFQAFVARADKVDEGRWQLTIDPL